MDKKMPIGELISLALALLTALATAVWWVATINEITDDLEKDVAELRRKVDTLEDKESRAEGRLSKAD